MLKTGSPLAAQTCDLPKCSPPQDDELLNACIEETFAISLHPERSTTGHYFLKHLAADLLSDGHSIVLNWDNFDNAILERLGMYEVGDDSDARTFNRIDYLIECFKRCRSNVPPNSPAHSKTCESRLAECKDWILRYTITYMLEPEVFNSKKNVDLEKYELVLLSLNDSDAEDFISCLKAKLKPDEYEQAFSPVLLVIQGKLKLYPLSVTDQDYLDASHILNFFTTDEHLAAVLVNSPNFLSPGPLNEAPPEIFSMSTLLGLLFGAVCTHTKTSTPLYFNVSTQRASDFLGITNSIRNSLVSIYDRVVQSFKRLLVHPHFKEPLLLWLHFCLESHSSRCKLGASLYLTNQPITPDGFFVNICYVALKLFVPISSDWAKVISKVEYHYCAHVHRLCDPKGNSYAISFEKEAMLIPKTPNPSAESPPSSPNSFNFPTMWYFFTHRALQIGLIPNFEKYLLLMQALTELNRDITDGDSSGSSQFSKLRMEALLGEQLCVKSQLLNPVLIEMLIEFVSATCVHLLNAINCNLASSSDIDFELCHKTCELFQFMPEFILDQIATCITHLAQFSPEKVIQYEDRLFSITLCFSIFMGNNEYVCNPHLRAKLAQSLHSIMGIQENVQYASYISVRSMFENKKVIATVLPKQLFRLFVDIEFTGHANEFQQKFSYRYHMYKILDYIWELPDYVECIRVLSKEAEHAPTDSVPLFLKFINLLVNDATYLLDEALMHLCKIHDLEHEYNSRQWENLQKEALEEKEKLLETSRRTVEGYNVLSRDTVHALEMLTSEIPGPFLTSAVVDRIASMLNYFLRHLVGEKKKDLKVQDMDKLHFDPKLLVSIICQIYVNLHEDDKFYEAIVEDERSFSTDLWDLALVVLNYIHADSSLVERFVAFKKKVLVIHQKRVENHIDENEIPDEFLDPISCGLIVDPVLLPSSKMIVDRTTITKHLLSDESDPFNRAHLRVDMLLPQPKLKEQIQQWLRDRKSR